MTLDFEVLLHKKREDQEEKMRPWQACPAPQPVVHSIL